MSVIKKKKIILELGPGEKKIIFNSIGIDITKKQSVDCIADFNKGLKFIKDNIVDEIHAYHLLEHIYNVEFFLSEIYRVLKYKGIFKGSVPHFSNPYFYSDYTHKNFWGLYSFLYFSKNNYFKRNVPRYYNNINFEIKDVKLIFSSPFRGLNKIKKFFQNIINSSKFFQEIYEENFVYLFPCYEIYFELIKS